MIQENKTALRKMEYENYLSDKSIKEKWNRLYQRDIINYREKLEEEVCDKIKIFKNIKS